MAEIFNEVKNQAQVIPVESNIYPVVGMSDANVVVTSDEITISFYEGEVPEFIELELERLYQSIYSTVARLRIYENSKNITSYVALKGQNIISAIIFRIENNKAIVLNEQTYINVVEISRFSKAVFLRYKSVTYISYWGLMPTQGKIPYLFRRNYCLPEIVVTLPEKTDAYLTSLGKSTRRHVRSNLKKITTTFPSFRAETSLKVDINAQDIFDIVNLNNERMAVKEKVTYNSDEETQRLIRLANVYGLVLTLKINDRVCAGAVCYRVGSTYFAHVLAHDPKFDDYKLGMVCCYLMISECITRGGSEVRFGGSTHRYKFDFLGILLYLDYLVVYKNIGHYILHTASALPMSLEAYVRRSKLWLLLSDRREDIFSRVAARIISRVREFKRSGYAL